MSLCRVGLCVLGIACALAGSFPAFAQSQRGLTLSQALQRALAANPRLTAAEREIGIATGRRMQAGAIPNPEISFDVDTVFGTGDYRGTQSAEMTMQVSQLLEFPGKRNARVAAAVAEVDATQWQRQAERLEVSSETAIAFVTVLTAQRRIVIYDTLIASLDGLLPLLQRRIDAGASPPSDIARAKVAADMIRLDRERTKTALATARRELAALMGTTTPDFREVVGDLGRIGQAPPFATVLAGLEVHPQLIRWTSVRAQRKAELLLARLKPLPDVKVAVGHQRINGLATSDLGTTYGTRDRAWRFGVSMDIPLWDQNQGTIYSAQETLAKTDAERAINKSALVVLLGKAYESLTGAIQELTIIRSSLVPNARSAVTAIEGGYAQGRFTLLELLDAQGSFAQAVQREQEALVQFHTAVATIEWLSGAPVPLIRARSR